MDEKKDRKRDVDKYIHPLELHGTLNALGTADHVRDVELLEDQGEGSIIRAQTLDRSLQTQEASIRQKKR